MGVWPTAAPSPTLPLVAKSSSAAPKRTREPKAPEPLDGIVAAIEENVRREGAVARAAVVAEHRVPPRRRNELLASLVARGLEVSAKHIRVPVVSQLAARLVGGAAVALRGLENAARGATKKDVADAAGALVEANKARWVVQSKDVALVDAGVAIVDEGTLGPLEEAATCLLTLIRMARRKRAGLLRADVEQALRVAIARREPQSFSPAPADVRAAADVSANDVTAIIEAHRERSGLTFVPKIVRALGGPEARDAVHAELLRGARAGVFELRPESGMGRLSAEDAAFCIPGPQGSTLSWVRRVEEAR
jgi:hypothetical protein